MAPVINLSVKFDANIFIGDRYIYGYFYCFADLAVKYLFPPILRSFFGGFDPLNVVGYCRDPHPWPETRVLAYRSFRSVKKCGLGAR